MGQDFRQDAKEEKAMKFLDTIVNKFHVILGAVTQAAIIAYHFKTGHDIGAGVQNTVYAFYAFLLGHAGVYQKYPDTPSQLEQK